MDTTGQITISASTRVHAGRESDDAEGACVDAEDDRPVMTRCTTAIRSR